VLVSSTHSCSSHVITAPVLVSNVKKILEERQVGRRRKDPGRGSKRSKASKRSGRSRAETKGESSEQEDDWIVAPAVRRSQRIRNNKEEEQPGTMSESQLDSGRVQEGDQSEEEGKRLCTPASPTTLQREPTLEEKEVEVVEEVEEWEEDDDWPGNLNNPDLEDNLTYHEDSLSILRGETSTPLGENIPIWVTTDTGSMTQLIQSSFAKKLKLKRRAIPEGKTFHINSPGGGRDEIEEYVILPLRVKFKRESKPEEGYDKCENPVEELCIKMKFGIGESLPVPILWGGKQMRKYDLLDYHSSKTLSLKVKGQRYITQSTSWLAATVEMRQELSGKVRKAYQPYLPSQERLSNMVMGGRETFNMPAILYPGKDNVVRVGRHNARVDEGYNEVLVNNLEEFALTYGSWVVPIECVTNGEAYIIVRNNADQPIRLNPGDLKLTIRSAVVFPHVVAPREVKSLPKREQTLYAGNKSTMGVHRHEDGRYGEGGPPGKGEEADWDREEGIDVENMFRNTTALQSLPKVRPAEEDYFAMAAMAEHGGTVISPVGQSPTKFITWNLNGLATRMKKGDLQERFYDQVGELRPDLISLQELKLPCEEGSPGVVKKGSEDAAHWEAFYAPLRDTYEAYLTLSSMRYGGQAVLVRRSVESPTVTYNMGEEPGHFASGRFMKLEFQDLIVRSVYAPFNGAGKEAHYQRRREWDSRLREEMAETGPEGKPRILLGDLNVAYKDSDLSDTPKFWKAQGDQSVAEGDRGFGGSTDNERERFGEIMDESGMADPFTVPLDIDTRCQWTFRGQGKFLGKGMKLDYVMVDQATHLSGGVKSSEILCGVYSRDGFMGSDHAPLMCELHPRWHQKRSNLLAHYAAMAPVREDEERMIVNAMFTNTAAVKTLPKVQPRRAKVTEKQSKGLAVLKPDAFPEHLWEYVDPVQRPLVDSRYARFKSREYLEECLETILTKLDIQPREEFHNPAWFVPWTGEPALQEHFLRAQALANPHVYFHPDPHEIAMAKDVVAEVVTTNEKPFKCRPRKLSPVQQAFLHAKTNIMLRMGQLEEANSEWCHGLVLVAYETRIQAFMEQHGGEAMSKMFEREHEAEVATFFRLCVDLRMLNARTVPDRFPLPRIDDLLESIPRACGRYSISDIADAFFKCELKKADRHKTAFRTHDRHLQFAVLPQGFINSPSVFCRLIARTFEGMQRERFSAYIDDVLNHSDDFQTHLETQQEMYNRLSDASLTLKLSKTHLNYERVKFLGHILTVDGRLPDPEAVEAIREWSDPTTTKEVRSFLGSTLYYREYIHGYSDMAMPLYDLIKKGVVVSAVWDDEIHGVACQRIKDALTSKPVLMQVDNTKPFRLKVDACRVGRGIGSILEQQNADGKWQPVSYYSCSLSKEERNYSATELECKALHDCILHYAVYLKYIPHFEVFSDHNALRYMVSSENATTNGRLMRYLLDLQEYNFAIYYRKGTENCDADAVSRLKRSSDQPHYLTEDELSKENGVVSKNLLERARALDRRNEKLEKSAKKLLNRLAKQELTEMSLLNDHILAEGVENLESESGRARFFKNISSLGLKCSRDHLDSTLDVMQEDKGGVRGEEEAGHQPIMEKMACLIGCNKGLSPMKLEEEGERLCTPEPLADSDDDSDWESWGPSPRTVHLVGSQLKLERSWDNDDESSDDKVEGGEQGKATTANPRDSDYGAVCAHSRSEIPRMLSLLVDRVGKEFSDEDAGLLASLDSHQSTLPPIPSHQSLLEKRESVIARVQELSQKVLVASSYGLRKPKRVCYNEEDEGYKVQPNAKDSKAELKISPINEKLKAKRKHGYGSMVIQESLIPGDTGWGLFADKKIKKGTDFCSYEGEVIPVEQLKMGFGSKDYVIQAIMNHKTMEVVCIDSPREDDCYGRYAQDPIDEDLVNAKILWKKGRMVLEATTAIEPGDEIYVHYGLDYWAERLHYLDKPSRARIEKRLKSVVRRLGGKKGVQFRGEDTVAVFKQKDCPNTTLEGVREEGEPTKAPEPDYRTRNELYELLEGDDAPEEEVQLDQALLDELAYENVHECEELADKLQFLNTRKFEDEGRMYEIMQVRYDPEFERIIGFRRPLSGKTPHKDDGSSFAVYGKEGLYELSEIYLLHHPEERELAPWPTNNVEWAETQATDPVLEGIRREIMDQGGGPVVKGKNKYALMDTESGREGLLVRQVNDLRKGKLDQAMVPANLVKSTLRMHHEGYGHMGANRMLETIRLRYFWTHMDRDIVEHCNHCLNCKLRKSYQRKPKVPIMKYDDTARPLDRVHVDLTGPLPLTKGKNRYIMVVKDYLTKYVWLIPLKTKTAMEVAEAFVGEFVCQTGVPGRVVSDRGNEFVNQLLSNVSKVMGINRISTTPYNPRSDGFVENHNKTLKDQLFHYVDNLKQDDWDVYLPTVQLMYNTTVSLATGYTPMLLMTGREARMPSLNHMASEDESLRKDVVNNAYVLKMVETMRKYQDFALTQTEKNKMRLNVRVRQPLEFVEYEVGQQFMRVRRPISKFKSADEKVAWSISAKLLERYEGPYRITKVINPVLYEAEIDGKRVRVHAVNMKPF
jgi:exodeoxyribonuclease III